MFDVLQASFRKGDDVPHTKVIGDRRVPFTKHCESKGKPKVSFSSTMEAAVGEDPVLPVSQ